jgi:hypothetical protein
MMRALPIALLAGLLAVTANAATVQTRLIRATNTPVGTDKQLHDVEAQLSKQFGYKYHRQLGLGKGALPGKGQTLRLDVGEGFTAFISPKAVEKQTHELAVELYSGRAAVAKLTVKLTPGGHVLAGPIAVGNDCLILDLSLRE